MAAVGGRMEAVAPRRSLFGPDYLLLAALALVSLGIHAWLIAHTKVTARDSIGFARYALDIQSPESSREGPLDPRRFKIDVIRDAQHPPGYPIAVWITAKFVRKTMTPEGEDGLFSASQLAESTLLATQIANAIAAVLLVVPTYFLGRMLFGRQVGFSAALLFQVLPVPAHITSDGLTEGVYLLAVATSLMLGVRAVRRPGVGIFLLTGLVVGVGYLVRMEALMVAGAVGLVALTLGVRRRWPRDLTLGRLAALVVGVLLVAGPYMILIKNVSNKPTPTHLISPSDNPKAILWKGQANAKAPTAGPLFAAWMPPSTHGAARRALWGFEAVATETTTTLHYLSAGLALIGIVSLRRRMAVDPGLWLLLALGIINVLILLYLASFVGYVSGRHTLLLALIGCLFAAAALEPLAAALGNLPKVGFFWKGQFGSTAILLILVGMAVPSAVKPMHANREGHRHAGHWLAANLKPGDCVIDPFAWAEWYAGRTLYYIPQDPPADPPPEFTYAVVDDKMRGDEHERLPRLDAAKAVLADGNAKPVYHWPEDVPEEQAKVKIYLLVRKTDRAFLAGCGALAGTAKTFRPN